MRVNLYAYPLLVLALFMGVIFGSQAATPDWQTSGGIDQSTGLPAEVTSANPDDIKGWMTLADVVAGYKVPEAEVRATFKIPAEVSATTALKELEKSAPGFSTTNLRTWLKDRQAAGK